MKKILCVALFFPHAALALNFQSMPQVLQSSTAKDFREAQLQFYQDKKINPITYQPLYDFPTQETWGSLPYAPLRELPGDLSLIDARTPHKLELAGPLTEPEFIAKLDASTHSELTLNSQLELFQDREALAPMIRLIRKARKLVFAEVLSLTCDESTEPLIQALMDQAKAGIDTRVIVNKGYALLSRSCLNKLSEAGVKILKAPIHSSLILNDQDELMIGSENWAPMNFNSDGFNFQDRDLMVFLKGPIATDALQDFLSVWFQFNGGDSKMSASELLQFYKVKRSSERLAKLRGQENESSWIQRRLPGLCRFVAEKSFSENTGLETLLLQLTEKSQSEIYLSGVNIDAKDDGAEIPLIGLLKKRSRDGLQVDYMGNGWDGGNGELTILLDEGLSSLSGFATVFKFPLESLRDWDRRRQVGKHFENYRELLKESKITVWTYFHFLHSKVASFDHLGVLVSSANFSPNSFRKFSESGVFCLDPGFADKIQRKILLDQVNSIPYQKQP